MIFAISTKLMYWCHKESCPVKSFSFKLGLLCLQSHHCVDETAPFSQFMETCDGHLHLESWKALSFHVLPQQFVFSFQYNRPYSGPQKAGRVFWTPARRRHQCRRTAAIFFFASLAFPSRSSSRTSLTHSKSDSGKVSSEHGRSPLAILRITPFLRFFSSFFSGYP